MPREIRARMKLSKVFDVTVSSYVIKIFPWTCYRKDVSRLS